MAAIDVLGRGDGLQAKFKMLLQSDEQSDFFSCPPLPNVDVPWEYDDGRDYDDTSWWVENLDYWPRYPAMIESASCAQ